MRAGSSQALVRYSRDCGQECEPQLQQREDHDGDDDTEDGWRERHCLPFHSFDSRSTSTCIGARTGHHCERRRRDINGKSARRRRDKDQARRQCTGQRGGEGAAFRHKGRFVPCHNRFGQPDGSQKATAILIFPPGVHPPEGFSNWDLPNSTMTNATVASQAAGVDGQTLTVTYKEGEKKIIVPPSAEIVTYKKASVVDLK